MISPHVHCLHQVKRELLIQSRTSISWSTCYTASHVPSPALVKKSFSERGSGSDICNQRSLTIAEVNGDVESSWGPGRSERWVLVIVARWADLDARTSGRDDYSIVCNVGAQIFLSVFAQDIKPDNGVRA